RTVRGLSLARHELAGQRLSLLRLERAEEVEDVLLVRRAQGLELLDHRVGFGLASHTVVAELLAARAGGIGALVGQDRLQQSAIPRSGTAVMEEEDPLPRAPQGCGAELVRARRPLCHEI